MYKHGLGTLETERSNVNHIVDMINIEISPLMNTPSHVMIGHGLVDLDHVSFNDLRDVYLSGSSLVILLIELNLS